MYKIISVLFILLIAHVFLFAQEVVLLPKNLEETGKQIQLIDTLYTAPNPSAFTSHFVFTGQDILIQWFVAPADLTLKEVGFAFHSAYLPLADVETKIVAAQPGVTIEDLQFLDNELWGYYKNP